VQTDPSLCTPALCASFEIRVADSSHCLHELDTALPAPVSRRLFPTSIGLDVTSRHVACLWAHVSSARKPPTFLSTCSSNHSLL
jgi:hypothetical protein